jgi:cytochrome c oxidase assembly protein subunit 15
MSHETPIPAYLPATTPYRRGLYILALLTAMATFPLIFMGGLVTSYQAGMSVPDWPNSYGYNMFLYPPRLWIGGILYEHTHRLAGCAVGFLSILLVFATFGVGGHPRVRRHFLGWTLLTGALAVVAAAVHGTSAPDSSLYSISSQVAVGFAALALILFSASLPRRREPRRWVRYLAMSILLAVIGQGVLGGLRVVAVNLDLAIIHGCIAQAFFCLTALMVAATSRWWRQHPVAEAAAHGQRIFILAAVAVLAIYLQLVIGAVMRHYQAGLAIPDLPLAYGHLLPPADPEGLRQANQWRLGDSNLNLPPVTMPQIWIHFLHRIGALLVTGTIVALVFHILRRHRGQPLLTRPAWTLLFLIVVQLTLGVLTVLWQKPADITSYHVAVGALTLITAFMIAVRSLRLTGAAAAAVSNPAVTLPISPVPASF